MLRVIFVSTLAAIVAGCNQSDEIDKLKASITALTARCNELQTQLVAADARAETQKKTIGDIDQSISTLAAQVQILREPPAPVVVAPILMPRPEDPILVAAERDRAVSIETRFKSDGLSKIHPSDVQFLLNGPANPFLVKELLAAIEAYQPSSPIPIYFGWDIAVLIGRKVGASAKDIAVIMSLDSGKGLELYSYFKELQSDAVLNDDQIKAIRDDFPILRPVLIEYLKRNGRHPLIRLPGH